MTILLIISFLILLPACAGYLVYGEWKVLSEGMARLRPGDYLIYRKEKYSIHPGARARNIWAAENGDAYSYVVDKFWAVYDVLEDGRLVAVTRTGKRHCLETTDRNLRKAGLIERLRFRNRFPHLDLSA